MRPVSLSLAESLAMPKLLTAGVIRPKCRNAQHGTYGHECGKTATVRVSAPFVDYLDLSYPFIVCGPTPDMTVATYCDTCWSHGDEARRFHNRAGVTVERVGGN